MGLQYLPWTRSYFQKYQDIILPTSHLDPLTSANLITCFGNGRSYSNIACAAKSDLLLSKRLTRIIDFNYQEGKITAESGCLLADIIDIILPHGWFLAVTPGTKFITLGGAIANDVHGKNHHLSGSFGCAVINFTLVRSTGERFLCSRETNSNFFYATIGGLGLTGWITTVTIQLIRVSSYAIISNAYKYNNLDEYFALNEKLESKNTYTVAWIDCLAKGKNLGRGIYFTGEHAANNVGLTKIAAKQLNFPIEMPFSGINHITLKIFNTLYYNRPVKACNDLVFYDKYFYPLDRILNWNRIYGRKGFFQYQLVIPPEHGHSGITKVLEAISASGQGSFLAVLKTFAGIASGGLLSFPRKGITLALDFANYGEKTQVLFRQLDEIVINHGGALYCAKDGRMSGELFKLSYPNWEKFRQYKDPQFTSQFWQKVVGE